MFDLILQAVSAKKTELMFMNYDAKFWAKFFTTYNAKGVFSSALSNVGFLEFTRVNLPR